MNMSNDPSPRPSLKSNHCGVGQSVALVSKAPTIFQLTTAQYSKDRRVSHRSNLNVHTSILPSHVQTHMSYCRSTLAVFTYGLARVRREMGIGWGAQGMA
jgi:hypothetical protein